MLPLSSIMIMAMTFTLISIGDALAVDQENDAKRIKVIAEAEALFKKKQFTKAKALLEKSSTGLQWTVDTILARRERLLGQVLIKLKEFEDSQNPTSTHCA